MARSTVQIQPPYIVRTHYSDTGVRVERFWKRQEAMEVFNLLPLERLVVASLHCNHRKLIQVNGEEAEVPSS